MIINIDFSRCSILKTVGNILLLKKTESCCECGIACIAVTLCAFGQHMLPGGELDAPPVRGEGGRGGGNRVQENVTQLPSGFIKRKSHEIFHLWLQPQLSHAEL